MFNENGLFFDNELRQIKGINVIKRQKNEFNTFWTYTLLSDKKKLIENYLNKNNIQCFQVHPRNDKVLKESSDPVECNDCSDRLMPKLHARWLKLELLIISLL